MKEMNYSIGNGCSEIFVDDVYEGIEYLIRNNGGIPCCYIACPEELKNEDALFDETGYFKGIDVHGGVTFTGYKIRFTENVDDADTLLIGWDYGHSGDWESHWSDEKNIKCGNHKWTTEMLVEECKDAISQINKLKEEIMSKEVKIESQECECMNWEDRLSLAMATRDEIINNMLGDVITQILSKPYVDINLKKNGAVFWFSYEHLSDDSKELLCNYSDKAHGIFNNSLVHHRITEFDVNEEEEIVRFVFWNNEIEVTY